MHETKGLATVAESAFERLDTSSALGRFALLILLGYLAVGTCFYSVVEGWEWTDALYFCVVTMTTVGYGDMTPSSDVSKAFTICFILLGLSLVATSLGLMISQVQGTFEETSKGDSSATAAAAAKPSRVGRWTRQIVISICTIVGLLATGAIFVSFSEGWSALDSIYWAVVTAASVGYGDLTIESELTKNFDTVWMLVAVAGCAVSLSKFGSIIMEVEAERAVDRFVARGVTETMIDAMDCDGTGSIDRGEFALYMLVAMGKVEQEDVDKVCSMFDRLDQDGSGTLDVDDVRAARETSVGAGAGGGGGGMPGGGVAPPTRTVQATAEELTSRGAGASALRRPLLS
jgi:potassium channel subfamily K